MLLKASKANNADALICPRNNGDKPMSMADKTGEDLIQHVLDIYREWCDAHPGWQSDRTTHPITDEALTALDEFATMVMYLGYRPATDAVVSAEDE